jgi:hypothetical protein
MAAWFAQAMGVSSAPFAETAAISEEHSNDDDAG